MVIGTVVPDQQHPLHFIWHVPISGDCGPVDGSGWATVVNRRVSPAVHGTAQECATQGRWLHCWRGVHFLVWAILGWMSGKSRRHTRTHTHTRAHPNLSCHHWLQSRKSPKPKSARSKGGASAKPKSRTGRPGGVSSTGATLRMPGEAPKSAGRRGPPKKARP